MRSIFKAIAAPIQARIAMHEKIMQAFEYVNRARIVTLLDFEDCFTQDDRTACGTLGAAFQEYSYDIRDTLAAYGGAKIIGEFHLPSGLANTHTRDVIKKHAYDREAHLCSYYLGDLLDKTDEHITLRNIINRAAVFGDGQHILDIVKHMQKLPDYSQHFPNRTPPPDNGETKKKRETSPGWSPAGQLQPTRF